MSDPYIDSVSLQLAFDGIEGSTSFLDSSPVPKTVTANGGAVISTAQSKAGGASGFFNGSSAYLQLPAGDGFQFSGGDFTIEAWVFRLAGGVSQGTIFAITDSVNDREVRCHVKNTGAVSFLIYHSGAYKLILTSAGAIDVDTWTHLAWVRSGDTHSIFVNGIKVAESVVAHVIPACSYVSVGYLGYAGAQYFFKGYIDSLRVTKGVARYTDNFTPPVGFGETVTTTTLRAYLPMLGRRSCAVPNGLLSGGPRAISRGAVVGQRNIYQGGAGRVAGTVKYTPGTPVHRRVRLMDEATGMVVGETWSDAATGAYLFDNVDATRRYTVISYDYTGTYRAVVADGQTASIV